MFASQLDGVVEGHDHCKRIHRPSHVGQAVVVPTWQKDGKYGE